jgi:Fe-Mn family superoxide dismutase
MSYNFIKWANLQESNTPKTLELYDLSYGRASLDPVISKETIDLHFGKLAKGYVDRYNASEGDPTFNEAGAFLHNILFAQFKEPVPGNLPTGAAKQFIEKWFKTFDNFKEKFEIEAMKLQGSNWVYLARNGEIKTIKNHETRSDIVLLIDWWEHAFLLDYGSDKKKYLSNQWKIINWEIISAKVG